MHALTGWIPERVAIRVNDEEFNADAIFERLSTGQDHGRCLITVATGDLTDEQGERTGLVPTHAYAVLNMREVDVSRTPLLIFMSHEYAQMSKFLMFCIRV